MAMMHDFWLNFLRVDSSRGQDDTLRACLIDLAI